MAADHQGYVANEAMWTSAASSTTTMPNHRPQLRPIATAPPAAISRIPSASHSRAQIQSGPYTASSRNQLVRTNAKMPSRTTQAPEKRSMRPLNRTHPPWSSAMGPAILS